MTGTRGSVPPRAFRAVAGDAIVRARGTAAPLRGEEPDRGNLFPGSRRGDPQQIHFGHPAQAAAYVGRVRPNASPMRASRRFSHEPGGSVSTLVGGWGWSANC